MVQPPDDSSEKHNNETLSSEAPSQSRLVTIAVNNPHLVVVGCLLVAIFGILTLIQLPKDLLPAANLPAVQILSFYSGMPVRDIEENLSARFERYTGQAIGMSRQESKSLVGVSVVKNYFNEETDLNTAMSQTTSLVLSVLRRLPPGTQPPLILPFDPMAAVPLALVAVSADVPESTLYDTARYQVRNAIQAMPGVMAPTVMGGAQREAIVYLNQRELDTFNLSPTAVIDRLDKLNTFVPTGDVKIGPYDYQILSNGLPEKIDEMNDFPLRAKNGVSVFLKQVGEAKDANQIQTNVVLIDGKPQVYVPVYRQPGANSLQVVENVHTALEKLGKRLKGYTLSVVADQSIFIRNAVDSIAEEAAIGGGLAVLMVLFFLGDPRATVCILLCLSLALLIPFLGMRVIGQSINAMTLGGLALSVGILVDNSIVVLENISTKLDKNMPTLNAAVTGASELAMPVLSSTLATLSVLFPVILLSGIVKTLFSALASTVMFAMAGSYFIAMTAMPFFASRFLQTSEERTLPKLLQATRHGMQRLTLLYGRALAVAIRHRRILLGATFVLLVTGLFLATTLGIELFPRADSGNFMLDLRIATGTRIEKTVQFAQEIDQHLREWIPQHDLKMVITNAGVYYGFPAAFTPNSGTQDVFFNVELAENREHTSQYYAAIIRKKMHELYPDVDLGIELGGLLTSALNYGQRAPIDVQIEGPDANTAHQFAELILPKVRSLRGAVDARIQQRLDAPEIVIQIDRTRAGEFGIAPDDIVKNVVGAVAGSATYNPSIWVDPKTGIDYLFGVQFPENSIKSIQDLGTIPIRSMDQNRAVPLSRMATLTKTTGPSEATHVNLIPVIDLFVDAQGRDIGSLARDIQHVIDLEKLPEGYFVKIRGEVAEMNESIKSLGGGFALATILVYLILVVQFRSYSLPLVILVAVPTGMMGIILMLVATHTYFSIQAAIGAIFMIGIAVANGVLLVQFIQRKLQQSDDIEQSIIQGAQARFRPIVMTALASILGLTPMAIGLGHGSEANIPLGRAVIGGQLVSTLLTLFLVPIFYWMLAHRQARLSIKP